MDEDNAVRIALDSEVVKSRQGGAFADDLVEPWQCLFQFGHGELDFSFHELLWIEKGQGVAGWRGGGVNPVSHEERC